MTGNVILTRCACAVTMLALLVWLTAGARADDRAATAFQPRVYTATHPGWLPYGLFVPRNLEPGRRYPVILFLHSERERGWDNKRQLKSVEPWTKDDVQSKFPCFIVAPQCPNWREVFQLYGSNRDLANPAHNSYAGAEKQWKHFQVMPGKQLAGRMNCLFFLNDTWGNDKPVDSAFRNVKVYETGQGARAKPVDFRKVAITPYAGGGRGNNPTVEDDGATLHFVGDSRKKIPMAYTVTKNTVVEFDFKSTLQGNIHGIGLDDDDKIDECRWVQVDLNAASHTLPKEPSVPMKLLMDLLPTLLKEYPSIDPRRIYLTGVSMGGFGVWDLLARRPEWFAAAVPVSGGADLETVNAVAPIPVWAFHGAQEGAVRPERTRSMIAALWNVGGEPRYTEYPTVGRDTWAKASSEPDLLPWLFSHKRQSTPPSTPANLRAMVASTSRVELSWSPARDEESGIKEYRVLRDGGEIGATAQTRFTDTEISEGDVHNYAVIAMNRAWLKSPPTAQVWAKVPADTSPLHIVVVRAQGSPYRVEIHFDKPVEAKSAGQLANYTLDQDLKISSAVLLPDQKTVRLETAAQSPKAQYTLTVANLKDRAAKPNALPPNTTVKFTYDPVLAAHWRLDEGEGQFSADATGNGSGTTGNVITFHSVDWVPGKWGKALNFDGGSGHYAWTVQSRSLDLTEGLTVSLWIRKTPGLYGHQIIAAKSNHFDRRTQFMLDFDPSHQVRATVGTMDRGEITVTGRRIDARDWHHVALTFGAGKLELFIDGESQGQASGGDKLVSVSEAITIGAGHQGRDPMRGALDEIRIYSRRLSPANVKELASAVME